MQVLEKTQLAPVKPNIILGWLFDAPTDMAWFYCSLLPAVAALLFLLHVPASNLLLTAVLLQGLGLGPLHQGITYFHLLDKTNRKHFFSAQSNGQFLTVPLLILGATTAATVFAPQLVYIAYLLWTVQHMTQQNVGLLLLYHKPHLREATAERSTETRSQHVSAALFSFLFLLRFADSRVAPLILLLVGFLLVETIIYSSRYILEVGRAFRGGGALNIPALSFWLLSMFFFAPMALPGVDLYQALFIPLIVHWFQYIGLNWMIIKRKYDGARRQDAPLAQPLFSFVLCGLALIGVTALLSTLSAHFIQVDPALVKLATGLLFGIGFAHYWHDALIWRFREPHNRENMLAFIRS